MLTWIRVALALLKLVNAIIRKYDQKQWEASGYRKAMADELLLIKDSVGLAEKDFEAAKAMTAEERRRRLGEPV